MPDNDEVIERDVVLIEPDLSGFRRKLERKMAREMAGAKIELPVYLKEAQAADNYVAGLRARMLADNFRRVRNFNERVQAAERAAYAERTRMAAAAASATAREEERASRVAERESARRQRVMERETAARERARKSFNDYRKGPPIIDFGGKGVRPMNLLLGAVTALTPALFAMSANAVQAATSLTALGSAGIGAALGIGGVVTAFQGLGDVLSLRKQVQNEALTKAANVAVDAKSNLNQLADATADYRTALREERRAEEAIHVARREAARDLDDLRRKVVDLNNEYRSNQLSVREAEENERSVNRNFFATATERLRAHQDTLDARTRLGDTALQRRQAQEDLRESIKKGVANADKVINAQDAYVDAKRRRQQAGHSLQNLRSGADAAAVGKVSSAAAQLEQKLKDMAPAARDIYFWFDRNEKKLKAIQRDIAQATLPGFYRFLQEISRPVQGRTTIQVFADAMGELGALAGKYTGQLGAFSNTPFFRSNFATIQRNNAEGFDILGKAGMQALKPITRILAAASPLFPKMAKGLANLIGWFDKVIARAEADGSLGKWFADAYESGRKWMSIAGNLLRFLGNIFRISLPTGTSLVDRLVAFTDKMADWSGSPAGERAITRFFEFFRDLPYDRIREFLTQSLSLFAALHVGRWAKANPFFTAIGLLATSHPDAAITFMTALSRMVSGTVGLVADHPEAAATLLAILSAAKLAKAVNVGLSLPGLSKIRDMLTSKFKVLDKFIGGGATTGTMTVNAGVVNVYGKLVNGGGVPGVDGPGGVAAGKGEGGKKPGPPAATTRAGKIGNFVKSIGLPYVAIPMPKSGDELIERSNRRAEEYAKTHGGRYPDWYQKAKAGSTSRNEALSWNRLVNNLSSFGKDSTVTKSALDQYIADRKARVKEYVDYVRSTEGPIAAAKAQQDEDKRSQTALSNLLQQFKWSKAAAEVYTKQVYGLTTETQKSREAILNSTASFDSMGNALDGTKTKADLLEASTNKLKGTIGALVGNHVISLSTENYGPVKKQLDLLYATQHVLYNPNYSNSAGGADTISSQNQFLDPKTGLPKRYMKARGGPIFGPGTATSDSIPAWLSHGEYVMPAKTVQEYGLGLMESLRQRKFAKYAEGGPVMPFVVNLPKKGFQFPEVTLGPAGGDQEYLGRTPRGLGAVAGLGVRMMQAVIDIHRRFPWASVTSGYRPGAITVTGNRSYHGRRRATDWPASMELFNYFVQRFGNFAKEIIYSPAGGRQIWNGAPHMYSGAVRNTHWNHVHLALAGGGPALKPRKYDTGGVLPPGYTLAYNGTGRNETVRTAKQEQALTRLDSRDVGRLIAALSGNQITMDGRAVAEVTNRYNYVPAGV